MFKEVDVSVGIPGQSFAHSDQLREKLTQAGVPLDVIRDSIGKFERGESHAVLQASESDPWIIVEDLRIDRAAQRPLQVQPPPRRKIGF